jgi:tetratricopeptide (TPR) repeat protein
MSGFVLVGMCVLTVQAATIPAGEPNLMYPAAKGGRVSEAVRVSGFNEIRRAGSSRVRLLLAQVDRARYNGRPQSEVSATEYPLENTSILTRRGLELINQGRYDEAEAPLVRVYELTGGSNATATYNLASLYHRQGRLQEALRLHRLALEQIERAEGPFHADVAQSLNDIGAVYRALGRHTQAAAMFERAIQVLDRHPSAELRISVLNNLSAVYIEIGQYPEAERIAMLALAEAETARLTAHPAIARIFNNLGKSYFSQKKYAAAEAALERAVTLLTDLEGEKHPDYAIAVTNLAAAYGKRKRYREALDRYGAAIRVLEATAGPENPILAGPLAGYAEMLKRAGRRKEGRDAALRAKSLLRSGDGTVDAMALRAAQ